MSSIRSLLWRGIPPAPVVLTLGTWLGWSEGMVVTNLYPLAELVLVTIGGLAALVGVEVKECCAAVLRGAGGGGNSNPKS